jgi:hypothetical protein
MSFSLWKISPFSHERMTFKKENNVHSFDLANSLVGSPGPLGL